MALLVLSAEHSVCFSWAAWLYPVSALSSVGGRQAAGLRVPHCWEGREGWGEGWVMTDTSAPAVLSVGRILRDD